MVTRAEIETTVQRLLDKADELIRMLDWHDGDCDLEPSLGYQQGHCPCRVDTEYEHAEAA